MSEDYNYVHGVPDLDDEIKRLRARQAVLVEAVASQAEDEGLWFVAETAAEGYLQQALRYLHELIEREGSAQPECSCKTLRKALEPFTKHNSSEEFITITVRTADVAAARAALAQVKK